MTQNIQQLANPAAPRRLVCQGFLVLSKPLAKRGLAIAAFRYNQSNLPLVRVLRPLVKAWQEGKSHNLDNFMAF